MLKTENLVIAGTLMMIIAWLWGVMNGSLARGPFYHQQIVAVVTGISIAKLVETLFKRSVGAGKGGL